MTICFNESQEDKFHKTAEDRSRNPGSGVVRSTLNKYCKSLIALRHNKRLKRLVKGCECKKGVFVLHQGQNAIK